MECSPPGSSVHGMLQARILEWLAIPFSRGSRTWVSCIADKFFAIWATRKALKCVRHIQILKGERYGTTREQKIIPVGNLMPPCSNSMCLQNKGLRSIGLRSQRQRSRHECQGREIFNTDPTDHNYHQAVNTCPSLPTSSWEPEWLGSAKDVTTWNQLPQGSTRPTPDWATSLRAQPWQALCTHPSSICCTPPSSQHNWASES